jgi:hypothetical protein
MSISDKLSRFVYRGESSDSQSSTPTVTAPLITKLTKPSYAKQVVSRTKQNKLKALRQGSRGKPKPKVIRSTIETIDQRYIRYQKSASQRDKEWGIDKHIASNLFLMPCNYCGREASEEMGLNGIDRVNNSVGYRTDNVVSCCGECNAIKGRHSLFAWLENCIRVARRYQSGLIVFPSQAFVEDVPPSPTDDILRQDDLVETQNRTSCDIDDDIDDE